MDVPCLGGKILIVNLSLGKCWSESTMDYVGRHVGVDYFLGGKQINTWMLYKEVEPWVTPLEPSNKLIFGVGSLVGTLAPTASRFSVESKNALTGGYASSNAGSHFASELKYAGFDHIIVGGRASKPVYLWIDDSSIEIRNAKNVWGKQITGADTVIKEEIGDDDIQTALIGPAGENLVRSACILAERARAAGRCGLGAVMGSKNLKGIAVRGSGEIVAAHPDRFMEAVDSCWQKIMSSTNTERMGKYGTGGILLPEVDEGPFEPNYADLWTPEMKEVCDGWRIIEEGTMACFSCPIHCSHFYRVVGGCYDGTAFEGIEGNDPINFGSNFGISYKPSFVKGHHLVSELGLDEDNATRVIAWATECYQRGIIDKEDTGGVELEWGNHELLMEMLSKLAYREGFGDTLAEGCMRAAQIIGRGSEKYCLHIKGQELFENMRTLKSWALGVCVAARGGGHTTGSTHSERQGISEELAGRLFGAPKAGVRLGYEDKAKAVWYIERLTAVCSSMGMCIFSSVRNDPANLLDFDDYAELFSSATGLERTGKQLKLIGERVRTVEKVFNVIHRGFSRDDDYPPQRLMTEGVRSGPYKGEILHREKWDKMLDEYYTLHGWNPETSWPMKKTLDKLGLETVAEDLKKIHRIR